MAGFSSMDDFINEATVNGKFYRSDWNKLALPTTAQVAGEWYDLYPGTGTPGADGFTPTSYGNGTNLAFQPLVAGSGTVGIPTGGDVSPDTKHIINAAAFSAGATTMPCIFMLIDILGYYPITTVTTSGGAGQTLNNTQVFPQRYNTTADGASGHGLRCFVVASPGSATTPMGAATPNISIIYTNSLGVTGRTTPLTLPVGKTAAPKGHIVYSGVAAAGKYGPFMPLAAGDQGIKSIENFKLSSSYLSGVLNLVVCRPLLTLPMTTVGVAAERDLVNQLPSLPRVYDGSVLSWLMYAGAATPANSAFYGHLDMAWG